MTDYIYPVVIRHIFISPGHNYFGRPKDGPGSHATRGVDEVLAQAGLGLTGDRYFGVAAHLNAQVTFVAAEVFAAALAELGLHGLSPVLMSRNVVIEGVPLNQLIGKEFTLDFDGEPVEFLGASHCAPCEWMDAQIGPGARKALAGRGGLRARILSDGVIRRGPATLRTTFPLDLSAITAPLARPRLP